MNLISLHRVCWDFAADQPIIATYLSRSLNVAYHLLEVRTGANAIRPASRTGKVPEGSINAIKREVSHIMEMMRGEDGAIKRRNAEKIRDALSQTTQEGGYAYQSLVQLLDDLHA
jgi:hypothetical protein